LDLKLLVRDESGNLKYASGHIETTSDISSEAIRRFHFQSLDNAKQSLNNTPPAMREIRGTAFVIPRSKLPQAKEMLRKFQDEFCDALESPDGDSIYQIEMAFFPLTRRKG